MNADALPGDRRGFDDKAKEVAERLHQARSVTVLGHIDADGITAAAIASTALKRAGIEHKVRYAKKIDPDEVAKVDADPAELVWLVDLGSGYLSSFQRKGLVVTDHHVINTEAPLTSKRKLTLMDFDCGDMHLNPHAYGFDGATEISGSGTTYWVAKAMDPANHDLAPVAVVGAVGDFQDSGTCRLIGLNRCIVADGLDHGFLESYIDLRLFGRETRPLGKLLQYASDPTLPGLTNDDKGCNAFLSDLGIEVKRQDRWRTWSDLDQTERKLIVNALVDLLLDRSKVKEVYRLLGEVYVLSREDRGTELRDAKEFATLLNSCGRYGKADVGLQVCVGDRNEHWRQALSNLRKHRENLADAINLVKGYGTVRMGYLQYIKAGSSFALPVEDTVVGIVAGMILGSGEIDDDVPIFAFAETPEGKVKVSGRGTRSLVQQGLDLSQAMRMASETVGGSGGGHNIAAGATIPMDSERPFLEAADAIIGGQLRRI